MNALERARTVLAAKAPDAVPRALYDGPLMPITTSYWRCSSSAVDGGYLMAPSRLLNPDIPWENSEVFLRLPIGSEVMLDKKVERNRHVYSC